MSWEGKGAILGIRDHPETQGMGIRKRKAKTMSVS